MMTMLLDDRGYMTEVTLDMKMQVASATHCRREKNILVLKCLALGQQQFMAFTLIGIIKSRYFSLKEMTTEPRGCIRSRLRCD